jgi:transposase
MIAIPSRVQVWLATGHTDMRKGFDGLAVLVQEVLKRDPHKGHLFVFRGRRGGLIKVLWHDGQGLCLYAKRLERGRFIWPSTVARDSAEVAVTITPAQQDHGLFVGCSVARDCVDRGCDHDLVALASTSVSSAMVIAAGCG